MRRLDSIYEKTPPPVPLIHTEEIPLLIEEKSEPVVIEEKSEPQVAPKFFYFYKSLRIFILLAITVLSIVLIYPWSTYFAEKKSEPAPKVALANRISVASVATPVSQESFFYLKRDDLEIKAPVVAGIDDEALKKGIGHHNDSVWPDMQGNVVLAGHSFSLDAENAYGLVFAQLRKVELGDQVMIYNRGKNFYYKVFNRKLVSASDTTLFGQSDKWILTFYTCDPPKTDWRRLVFQAELVKVE